MHCTSVCLVLPVVRGLVAVEIGHLDGDRLLVHGQGTQPAVVDGCGLEIISERQLVVNVRTPDALTEKDKLPLISCLIMQSLRLRAI